MEEEGKTPSNSEEESKLNEDPFINKLYFSKYRAIKKLGEGSFGKVYKAEFKGEFFALKFESRKEGSNLLEAEATIMSYLKGPNIPSIKSFGYNNDYNILVMELMGKSLEDIFNARKKFSVKTAAMLGYQMINVLQFIHDRHIIHRDIKPDNFVMGYDDKNAKLYLLDFGLAKKFRSSKTLIQYPYIKKKKLVGTARYASIHALEEMEQSRRDDLESLGYVLMYFIRGSLPWQGLRIKTKEDRYMKILEKKKETTSEELCKNFPEEFRYYIDYTRNLGYTENPDYDKLRNNFLYLVREKMCTNFDFVYDWTSKSDLGKRDNNYEENLLNNGNIKIFEKNGANYGEMQYGNNNFETNKTRAEGNEFNVEDYDNLNGNKINEKRKDSDDKVESKCCIM